MTRQEMAIAVDGAALLVSPEPVAALVAAAAELRKSCAGCKRYRVQEPPSPFEWRRACLLLGVFAHDDDDPRLPADGSGFCHEWSAK